MNEYAARLLFRRWQQVSVALFAVLCLMSSVVSAQEPEVKEAVPEQAPEKQAEPSPAQVLQGAMNQVEAFAPLKVEFVAGVMTLRGTTDLPGTREGAEALANKIGGVLYVNNLIKVEEKSNKKAQAAREQSALDKKIEEQLRAITQDVDEFKAVTLRVNTGIVHLEGRVTRVKDGEELVALAKNIGGVHYVANNTQEITDVSERISPAWKKVQSLAKTTISKIPLYILALVVFGFFWWLSKAVTRWQRLYRRLQDKPLVREIVKQIVRSVVIIVGLLIVLELLGITTLVGAVLGTAGVAGVALGFAFRDIIENYLASVLLSLRQPFSKGDFIQIDSHKGRVMRMTTRDTVLMTLDGNHVRIPNAQVFKSVLYNFSHNPNRRFDFVVGIGVEESITEAKEIALRIFADMDGILGDPAPTMSIDDLGDFSVLCHFYCWVDQRENSMSDVRSETIRRVKLAFEKHEIDMPEPIQRRYLYDMTAPVAQIAQAPQEDVFQEERVTRHKSKDEVIEDDSWKKNESHDAQMKSQAQKDESTTSESDLLDSSRRD